MWGNQAGFLWGAMQPAASGPAGVGEHRGPMLTSHPGLGPRGSPFPPGPAGSSSVPRRPRKRGPGALSHLQWGATQRGSCKGPGPLSGSALTGRAAQARRRAGWLCPPANPITPQGQLPLAPGKMGVSPTLRFTLLVSSFLRAPITKHNSLITPEAGGTLFKGSSGSEACAWPGQQGAASLKTSARNQGRTHRRWAGSCSLCAGGRQCSQVVLWRAGRGLPVGEAEAWGGAQHGRRARLSFGVTWRELRVLST